MCLSGLHEHFSSKGWAWAWVSVGWGSGPLGAATRCPRRRRPFHFFRDLAFFGDSERSGFAGHDDGRTDETGLTPDPHSKNRKSPKFHRQFFLAILNIAELPSSATSSVVGNPEIALSITHISTSSTEVTQIPVSRTSRKHEENLKRQLEAPFNCYL